ncbi:uncharacterized protein EMH_0085090 [Eimeria mitis]|uniref:Uncharacterized protein n=1 Tax=Eimeria mitis TaxID=44415 RepID=U6K700_9EIME|nr:uncharacterized protein EMH_0085090 [Eimeria mitis]CDJ33744.1 hypothetical protein EMH_0085090 [Eimeria mitis]
MVPFGTRRSVPLLQRAHALLSQDVLVDDQLKELAYVAEDMVAHLVRFEGQDLSQHPTYRAVVRLGIRFLLLDAVVCTLLLLKQTPDENEWRPIADAISHALPDPCIMPNFTERTHFSLSLGQELSNAIQILKTGKRPDPTRLLRIKRMMFCFTWSPARFRHKEFDAWRRQCKGGT